MWKGSSPVKCRIAHTQSRSTHLRRTSHDPILKLYPSQSKTHRKSIAFRSFLSSQPHVTLALVATAFLAKKVAAGRGRVHRPCSRSLGSTHSRRTNHRSESTPLYPSQQKTPTTNLAALGLPSWPRPAIAGGDRPASGSSKREEMGGARARVWRGVDGPRARAATTGRARGFA